AFWYFRAMVVEDGWGHAERDFVARVHDRHRVIGSEVTSPSPARPDSRNRHRSRVARCIGMLLLLVWMAACSPVYVLRAGYEEAKILSRRKSIAGLVAD